jgi:sugar phosphate isomerase/epimerase
MTKIYVGLNLNFAKFVYGHKKALEIARGEVGVNFVEIVPDMDYGVAFFLRKPDGFRKYYREVGRYADKIGVRIISMLTFYRDNVSICNPDSDVSQSAYVTMRMMAAQSGSCGCKLMGASLCTVHKEEMGDPRRYEELRNQALEYWKQWLVLAKEEGIEYVTLETMSTPREPPCTINEAKQILGCLRDFYDRNTNASMPVLCYDLGHGVSASEKDVPGDDDFAEWFKAFPHDIFEIHVKNTDSLFLSTWPFTREYREKGIIDLGRVVEAVKKYLRVPELYMIVEIPGKRGRSAGEDEALMGNRCTVELLHECLRSHGYSYNPAEKCWSSGE